MKNTDQYGRLIETWGFRKQGRWWSWTVLIGHSHLSVLHHYTEYRTQLLHGTFYSQLDRTTHIIVLWTLNLWSFSGAPAQPGYYHSIKTNRRWRKSHWQEKNVVSVAARTASLLLSNVRRLMHWDSFGNSWGWVGGGLEIIQCHFPLGNLDENSRLSPNDKNH